MYYVFYANSTSRTSRRFARICSLIACVYRKYLRQREENKHGINETSSRVSRRLRRIVPYVSWVSSHEHCQNNVAACCRGQTLVSVCTVMRDAVSAQLSTREKFMKKFLLPWEARYSFETATRPTATNYLVPCKNFSPRRSYNIFDRFASFSEINSFSVSFRCYPLYRNAIPIRESF